MDREHLKQLAFGSLEADQLQLISIDRVLDEFDSLLELSSVRDALGKARYQPEILGYHPDRVEVDTERQISQIESGKILSGSIDRLVVIFRDGKPFAAEILDFKTDAVDDSLALLWLDDRIQQHRPQLEAYARVVSKQFGIPEERVSLSLLMLSADELVRIPRDQTGQLGPSAARPATTTLGTQTTTENP